LDIYREHALFQLGTCPPVLGLGNSSLETQRLIRQQKKIHRHSIASTTFSSLMRPPVLGLGNSSLETERLIPQQNKLHRHYRQHALLGLTVTGVTAASSGTHTRWCRKQASSLALSSAPVAAGRASSLAPWRTLNGMCRYRRGAAEIPAGVSVTLTRGFRLAAESHPIL